jgi:hypothetical protein
VIFFYPIFGKYCPLMLRLSLLFDMNFTWVGNSLT